MMITDVLDNAVDILRQRERDYADFYQWISYVLESIESEIGIEALETTKDILEERFEVGGW